MNYKLYIRSTQTQPDAVITEDGKTSFLINTDNPDYLAFKLALSEGASLKDAEGNDMTAEQITTFLGTLK